MNRRIEGEEFSELQDIGFRFKDLGGFSAQPDSGGVAGGIVGKQEYGIEAGEEELLVPAQIEDLAMEEGEVSDRERDPLDLSLAEGQVAGVSEWSNTHAFHEDDCIESFEAEQLDEDEVLEGE